MNRFKSSDIEYFGTMNFFQANNVFKINILIFAFRTSGSPGLELLDIMELLQRLSRNTVEDMK